MHARKAILLGIILAVGLGNSARAATPQISPAKAAPPVVNRPPTNLPPAPAVHNAPPAPLATLAPPAPAHAPAAPSPLNGVTPAPAAQTGGGWWVQADFLLAWLDTRSIPPLVTTAPSTTPLAVAGVEGVASTQTLFGDNGVNSDGRCGFLFRAGFIADPKFREGFEIGFIVVGREGDTFDQRSNGSPILARPVFNAITNQNESDIVAFPNEQAGRIRVRTAADLIGTEVNYRCALSCLDCSGCGVTPVKGPRCEVDFLLGYRSLRYRDKVEIRQENRPLNTPADTLVRQAVVDSYYGRNMFNGVQTGLEAWYWYHGLVLDVRAMAALGQRDARMDVNGFTDIGPAAGPVTRFNGGLLAGQSAIGAFKDQETAFVGELSLRAGYQVNDHVTLTIGYTLLYFSSVIRSGELIDRTVNPLSLPPGQPVEPLRPATILSENGLWAQGLSLGFEVRY
jgi:hypothetical protein